MVTSSIQKMAASIFILLYLFSAPVTRELLKIPVLATHYKIHSLKDIESGFFTFLLAHYLYEDGTDKDADEDKKLPFKSVTEMNNPGTVSIKPTLQSFTLKEIKFNIRNQFLLTNEKVSHNLFIANIWQPPRFT